MYRQPKTNSQQGYAILITILLISTLAIIIFLTLQLASLVSVRSTANTIRSQSVFYATETAIHDALAKILASDFDWPPDDETGITDNLEFNGVDVTRTTRKFVSEGEVSIEVTGRNLNVERTLNAGVESIGVLVDIPLDIIIVIDTSMSMDNTSSTPCDDGITPCEPLHSAREAAKVLVDEVFNADDEGKHRIGVYVFSDIATQVIPLTPKTGIDTIKQEIDEIVIGSGPTNIGDGIHRAKLHLDSNIRPDTKEAIIILTDGSANYRGTDEPGRPIACPHPYPPTSATLCTRLMTGDDGESAVSRAQAAKDAGYQIYSIGLNISFLEPNAHAQEAWETLRAIGSTPNHYFDAPTQEDLIFIFQNIAGQLGQIPQFTINAQ